MCPVQFKPGLYICYLFVAFPFVYDGFSLFGDFLQKIIKSLAVLLKVRSFLCRMGQKPSNYARYCKCSKIVHQYTCSTSINTWKCFTQAQRVRSCLHAVSLCGWDTAAPPEDRGQDGGLILTDVFFPECPEYYLFYWHLFSVRYYWAHTVTLLLSRLLLLLLRQHVGQVYLKCGLNKFFNTNHESGSVVMSTLAVT